MTAFDALLRGGLLVDGTGSAGRSADVGILGDRILAIGDLSHVDPTGVALVLDVRGKVVTPGFIDPHGHSDASLFADGALASHVRQGFTTQLSGNCGLSVAPITPSSRELVELELRPNGVVATWRTFAEYLDAVAEVPLGPNVAFLVGHGTVRGAVLGTEAIAPSDAEREAMARYVEDAMGIGAFGLSTGLIYAPGMHAAPDEVAELVRTTARLGGLYATHMRNEAAGLFEALDEALTTVRAAGPGARLQISHLKAGAHAVWGRGREAVEVIERARDSGLDVGADQYPYTAAATSLQIVLPPSLLALGIDEALAALGDVEIRERVRAEMLAGRTGWENVAKDPGWDGIRIAASGTHADWAGHSIGELAAELERDPADVAFDLLVDDRLETSIVLDCMDEADVRDILAVPWIAVCTDAEGRRAGHPLLDAGCPHPRTYGTTARVLGRYARDQGVLTLETAVAKLTSVPARRIGLRDRGVAREGACADLVVFDPATVIDEATYLEPSRYPTGIEHVFVNGRAAVLGGEETTARTGRLLRYGSD
jgi:N-acyl-D-aspartate/D-glutamate deacylase